jgi:hypothetical protein
MVGSGVSERFGCCQLQQQTIYAPARTCNVNAAKKCYLDTNVPALDALLAVWRVEFRHLRKSCRHTSISSNSACSLYISKRNEVRFRLHKWEELLYGVVKCPDLYTNSRSHATRSSAAAEVGNNTATYDAEHFTHAWRVPGGTWNLQHIDYCHNAVSCFALFCCLQGLLLFTAVAALPPANAQLLTSSITLAMLVRCLPSMFAPALLKAMHVHCLQNVELRSAVPVHAGCC